MRRSDKRARGRAAAGKEDAETATTASAAVDPVAARYLFLLAALSAAMLLVRSYAASRVGFGDSEALYATYAQHPQPAYLDHPGLVGLAMHLFAEDKAPFTSLPAHVHALTSVFATLVPWVFVLASRLGGASWARAAASALVVAVVPEIAVGLFALTPDLLLAFLWPTAIGLALYAVEEPAGNAKAGLAWTCAIFLAGAATSAKASGALLLVAFFSYLVSARGRPHLKTAGPWLGIAAAAMAIAPVVSFEAETGWPMLRHRFVDTQAGFGPSLRGVGALLGGQLGYLGPVAAVLAVGLVVRLANAARSQAKPDDQTVLLAVVTFVPLAALVPFALLSRVAEPHWIAPGLLALPMFVARAPLADAGAATRDSKRLRTFFNAAFATGALLTVAAHAWVLVPASARLLPEGRESQLDIANELYGWPQVITAVRGMLNEEAARGGEVPVVVAPHWVLSAQLAAGLGAGVPIACDMDVPTDFDGWVPRAKWTKASAFLVVTDGRFPLDLDARYPDAHVEATRTLTIFRGNRSVRTFHLALLYKEALGMALP